MGMLSTPAALHLLRTTADALQARCDALPGLGGTSGDRFNAIEQRRAAEQKLVQAIWAEFGGRVTTNFNGTRIALHGVTASSTAGPAAAVTNWITAARRRLDEHS